jgi:hypothetical protein
MQSSVKHIARSLIALHGADALKVAEQMAENARKPGAAQSLEMWLAVVAEIEGVPKPV